MTEPADKGAGQGRGARGETPPARAVEPSRAFQVPEGVKHLPPEQIEALTRAFAAWRAAARGPRQALARQRVWLAYQLLRYAGAKPGDLLLLDLGRDLLPEQAVVLLGGQGRDGRRAPLPPELVAELRALAGEGGGGTGTLALDAGYLRRQFYARGREAGLPAELCNPRVLRTSRALELLRGGVPLTVVQALLGQGSADLTAALVEYDQAQQGRILHRHLEHERRLRTSARNLFAGRVDRVLAGKVLCQVEVITLGGHRVVATITRESLDNLGLSPGAPVCALVKAPWVLLALGEDPPPVSASNRLRGRLTRLVRDGQSVEARVDLADGVQVCALITQTSARDLGLTPGMAVWVFFKSSAVILTVD